MSKCHIDGSFIYKNLAGEVTLLGDYPYGHEGV